MIKKGMRFTWRNGLLFVLAAGGFFTAKTPFRMTLPFVLAAGGFFTAKTPFRMTLPFVLAAGGFFTAKTPFRMTLLVVLAAGLLLQAGCGGTNACERRANDTAEKLLECVTADGVFDHLEALQAIADEHDGNRGAGTPGYEASVDYVVGTLEAAGYAVERQAFDVSLKPPPTLQQTAPAELDFQARIISGAGAGKVSGPVIGVDLALGAEPWPADPAGGSSGCETADFANRDFSGAQDIALVQWGGCLMSKKALNAQEAGAEAVIILVKDYVNYHLGQPVGKVSLLLDGSPSQVTIPVVGVRFPEDTGLARAGVEAVVEVPTPFSARQENVLAELPGSAGGKVVMLGAHLDSAHSGPGISDNGSGSAAVLETAVQMAKVKPLHTVRFAWWGAEEQWIVGSRAYVESLSPQALDEILVYMNFDMIASPNYGYMIYGKGGEEGELGFEEMAGPFEAYYDGLSLPYKHLWGEVTTDHTSFSEAGVPAVGVFAGASEIKLSEDAALWGGEAGQAFDPCYHLACDTTDNINLEALDVNADAVALAALMLAMDSAAQTGP